jgi:hypothetical protein
MAVWRRAAWAASIHLVVVLCYAECDVIAAGKGYWPLSITRSGEWSLLIFPFVLAERSVLACFKPLWPNLNLPVA